MPHSSLPEEAVDAHRVARQHNIGRSVTYHGTVEGFSAGSGAAFLAIPAQNATGNWIKVVQRLPVRIKLDPAELQANPLKVGLSMSARIDTRQN